MKKKWTRESLHNSVSVSKVLFVIIYYHPKSDIRFGYMKCVNELNLGFYCGFPLFSEDYTVIGSLCCMGPESRKLSQEEFTVMQKLADVTSRILRTQGNRAKDAAK